MEPYNLLIDFTNLNIRDENGKLILEITDAKYPVLKMNISLTPEQARNVGYEIFEFGYLNETIE